MTYEVKYCSEFCNCSAVEFYTETKFLVATLQFHFSNLTLMILNFFLPKYVQLNGLKLSGALEEFLSLYNFLVQKCKKTHKSLKKIRVSSALFYEVKYR